MRSAAETTYLLLSELERRGGNRKGGDGVVVYLPGHLGDFLEATPMLKVLRVGTVGRRVTWLVGGWSMELAKHYVGWADEIIEFSPQREALLRGRKRWRQSVWGQWRLLRRLRRTGVDTLVTCIPCDWITRFMANTLRPRVWAGVGDRRPPRVREDVRTEFLPYQKDRPEAEVWMEALVRSGLCAGDADARSEFSVSDDERAWAAEFLRSEGVTGRLVLLSPGSGWSGKNWGAERFAALAGRLESRGLCVAWTGSAGEAELGRGPGLKWAGKLSLGQLAAVMERSAAWVGNDSGTMHLAGAVGCRTVSFWGPTSEGKWGLRGTEHVKLRGAAACPGCVYWDWQRTCEKEGHPCMAAIGVEAAETAVLRVLEEAT